MDLATTNNQTFIWTVSLSQWALLFNLSAATFRMQIRSSVDDPNVALTFDSGGSARGKITYDPVSQLLQIRAPYAVMLTIQNGTYVFDLVGTLAVPSSLDPFVKIFAAGNLIINEGISK